MIINRTTAAAAAFATLLSVVALAGCSSAPSTPEEKASATAEEWRKAVYSGDQDATNKLFCDQSKAWDVSGNAGKELDKGAKFDSPQRNTTGGYKDATYDVFLRNSAWSSGVHVYINTSTDPACVVYAS